MTNKCAAAFRKHPGRRFFGSKFAPEKPGFVQARKVFHQPRMVSNVKSCGVFRKSVIFAGVKKDTMMPKINPSSRPVWAGKRVAYESSRVTKRWEGYNGSAWRTFTKWFKDTNPVCCVDGCNQPTYYTDHKVRVLDWIAQGGNPLDPANCQPLCYKHGNIKTGKEGRNKQLRRDGGGKQGPGGV